MQGMKLAVAMTTLVVVGVLWPGASSAQAGHPEFGSDGTMEFGLKGSNGYSVTVVASDGNVSLMATHGGSSATYSAPGSVSMTKIKARFGQLGRISMRFHPDHGPRRVASHDGNCKGAAEIVEPGTWVGQLEFNGEHEYTAVHATRAKGRIAEPLKQSCGDQGGEKGNSLDFNATIVQARSNQGFLMTALRVVSKEHPARELAFFSASIFEWQGRRLSVIRSISASGKSDTFTSTGQGDHITSVTIAPSTPFEGTATFDRTNGHKGTWSGSLIGDFPGLDDVALAGSEFSAKILKLSEILKFGG